MDLSGPHEATPRPGARVGASNAHYFLVVTVKFSTTAQAATAPETDVQEAGGAQQDSDSAPAAQPGVASEEMTCTLMYADLLEKKSETPVKLQGILAQIRSEHGSMPSNLVYRIHSDKGLEFLNTELDKYLRYHGINPRL